MHLAIWAASFCEKLYFDTKHWEKGLNRGGEHDCIVCTHRLHSLKKGVKQESVDFEVGADTHYSTLVSGVEENFMQNACILIAFIDEKKESSRDFKMQF